MLIESKIKRDGGSKIDIGGVVYHFAPNEDGAHVCDVQDEDAIARFLSIPEGFRLVSVPAAAPVAAPAAAPSMDLDGLDDANVRLYAKDRGLKIQGIALMKGANLRAKVAAAMQAKD